MEKQVADVIILEWLSRHGTARMFALKMEVGQRLELNFRLLLEKIIPLPPFH